jgi:hypothetical protein
MDVRTQARAGQKAIQKNEGGFTLWQRLRNAFPGAGYQAGDIRRRLAGTLAPPVNTHRMQTGDGSHASNSHSPRGIRLSGGGRRALRKNIRRRKPSRRFDETKRLLSLHPPQYCYGGQGGSGKAGPGEDEPRIEGRGNPTWSARGAAGLCGPVHAAARGNPRTR